MKIDGWVKKLINDPARDIRERVFIVLTMSATVVSAIALIGDLIYGSNILEIITLIAAVIAIPVITYVGVKTDRIQVMTRIVAFALIIVIVPVVGPIALDI